MRIFASAALMALIGSGIGSGLSTGVNAQAAPTKDSAQDDVNSSQIIVTAPTDAPVTVRERRTQLREMATDIINVPRAGRTVATFFEAICPKVIGLPEEETRVIEARIAENARTLGVNRRNPRENCTPNVTVIFVPPTSGPPEAWMTDDNDMLGHLLSYQRKAVLEDSDPVRAWTFNLERSADGAAIANTGSQSSANGANSNNKVWLGSRLRSRATVEIKGSAVMIELTSAAGKTMGQLADYASMRTFGNARSLAPGVSPAADTILTLFRDESAPEELTTFDRALISKMYDTTRSANARRYYAGIANRAVKMEEEAAQRP